LRRGHIGAVLRDIARFPRLFREVPFWRRRSREKRSKAPDIDPIPKWLNDDFVNKLNLRERYFHFTGGGTGKRSHPIRPGGYDSFSIPMWQWLFEWHDPGVSGLALEVRNPFVDIRMIRFLLAVPVIPWCRDKYLVRRALAEYLPKEIINRSKTSLAGFPAFERWKETGLEVTVPYERFAAYLDARGLEAAIVDCHEVLGMKMRSLSLAFFLRSVDGTCIIEGT
jgi:hypothetical protein